MNKVDVPSIDKCSDGDWTIGFSDGSGPNCIVADDDKVVVTVVTDPEYRCINGPEDVSEEEQANLKLIRAAKEMRETIIKQEKRIKWLQTRSRNLRDKNTDLLETIKNLEMDVTNARSNLRHTIN